MKVVVFLIATTFLLVTNAERARADGMRCGHRLVSDGDSIYRVEARCGPPHDARTWVEYRTERVRIGIAWVERTVEVKYEEWMYDFGHDRLVRYLVFENGRLLKVDTGPHGEKA